MYDNNPLAYQHALIPHSWRDTATHRAQTPVDATADDAPHDRFKTARATHSNACW